MKISVIIPTYNAEATIQDAITSCINQTYAPHEIIVVNDCSTDNTLNILKQFEQITIINQPNNQGPSAARNKGWNMATGDIIAFLDSDDIWHIDKLNSINTIFAENSNITYLGHSYTLNDFTDSDGHIQPQEKSFLSILLRNPYQPSCLALRADIKERFNENYRYCEDHELSVRIAHKYNAHYLPVALTKLGRPQLSTGGASANKWKMRLGELRIYSSVYKLKLHLLLLIPILWIYSITKMLYRAIVK